MNQISRLLFLVMVVFSSPCVLAADPAFTITELNARLAKIGSPRVQGTDVVAGKIVAALFFGNRKINGNYDLVDTVRKDLGALATVFVRDGDEFVRVSTNVMTPEGRRGVGTLLAHNKAYEALLRGKPFCGVIDVLGTSLNSCYNPILNEAGQLVGASYVGHRP